MGGGSTSTTEPMLPPELRELYLESANRMLDFQKEFPLSDAMKNYRKGVAGGSAQEKRAREAVGGLYAEPELWKDARHSSRLAKEHGKEMFTGASQMMNRAERMRTGGAPQAGETAAGMNFRRQVAARPLEMDAATIAQDAGLQAAKGAFEQTTAPMLGNQMAAMGLADSGAHAQRMANAWAATATPHVQAAQAREMQRREDILRNLQQETQDRLGLGKFISDRQMQAMGYEGQALGLQDQANRTMLSTAGMQGDLAQQQWARDKGAIDTGMQVGGVFRSIEDAENQAAYEDFLRQQGLAEKALYAPFGQAAAGLIGSKVTGGGK